MNFLWMLVLAVSSQAFWSGNNAKKGFESGDLSGWSKRRLAYPGGAGVISDPVRYGKFAAAVRLFPGQRYKDGWKSELSDEFNAPFNQEIWYRVSHYLPSSFKPAAKNTCTIAQWHNSAPVGSPGGRPPLAHRYRDGRLDITLNYALAPIKDIYDSTSLTIASIPNFSLNRWHDFVYRVVFAADKTGMVDIWYNGKRIARYRGPVGYRGDPVGPYFKTGVYCYETPARPLTAYVDEYRRGNTAKDVLLPGEKIEGSPRR